MWEVVFWFLGVFSFLLATWEDFKTYYITRWKALGTFLGGLGFALLVDPRIVLSALVAGLLGVYLMYSKSMTLVDLMLVAGVAMLFVNPLLPVVGLVVAIIVSAVLSMNKARKLEELPPEEVRPVIVPYAPTVFVVGVIWWVASLLTG